MSEFRKPNVKWCEAQNDSWVVEPANTWSNLAYLLVGWILFSLVRKVKSPILKFYPVMAIVAGLCSLIYHSSYTFVLQILDFFGMYVIFFPVLFINLIRMGVLKKEKFKTALNLAVIGTTISTVALDFTSFPIQGLILAIVLVTLFTEAKLWFSKKSDYEIKNFLLSSATIGLALFFSYLDVSRKWCNPDNHIVQGHAIWHCLSAVSVLFMFQHQKQFDEIL